MMRFVFRPLVAIAALASLPFFASASRAESENKIQVPLRWLDQKAPLVMEGASFGIPWPKGTLKTDAAFVLKTESGQSVPLQTWPLAYWPDGSLKWSALAVPAKLPAAESYSLELATSPQIPAKMLVTQDDAEAVLVDTGVFRTRILKKGTTVIDFLERDGRHIAEGGSLVCLVQDRPGAGVLGSVRQEAFHGEIGSVTLEQNGPVRAVVKIEGKHRQDAGARVWLPFVLRLYFYAGSESVRVLHTIIYDGDENKDFIRGLGLRFAVPLHAPLHDRHVRFSGQQDGLFAEAVRGLTGLRRDPGEAVTSAQLEGRATPATDTWPETVSKRLELIPAFGDWTLFQGSADGFEIRKRTKDGHSWLKSASGQRAGGLGYLGTPEGGLAFGLRYFWQSYPAQFDIRGATTDKAEFTLWLWAPEAAPMDLRFYHDGMGMDDYAKQNEGLEITYEDYEPGFGKPEGVARTSELFLWAMPATPSRARLTELSQAVAKPPFLTTTPETLLKSGVFARLWSLPDRSTPAKAAIEDRLDALFSFYQKQVDERGWYGFWNYGDVMHSYDKDRHTWKYDVGGFAWDNSELSTDIWLWLTFLRSGRADVFRFAEAMTRHTGEVDVHHLGRFAPLGSRHNVMHWGCSAKQLRISTAQNRRYYYYLSADERVGDLMREQVEAVRKLVDIQPGRKVGTRRAPPPGTPDGGYSAPKALPRDENFANVGFGTDWGAVSAAWLTEWERTGDKVIRDRLFASMRTIAAQPHGFFTGSSRMNLSTGEFEVLKNSRAGASHLSAAFGLPEVCAELVELCDIPEFNKAWLQYCRLYSATPEEQRAELGATLRNNGLRQGHSKLVAFAGRELDKPELRRRAWSEFASEDEGPRRAAPKAPVIISGPSVLKTVEEFSMVSTNGTAQWGMAAIQCLALAGDQLPEEKAAKDKK